MAKMVNLSAHRNTLEGRRKREAAKAASGKVLGIMRQEDISAYAFVGISSTGDVFATWDTGAIMPMVAFPEVVRSMLAEDMAQSGVQDDWKAGLKRGA